MTSLWTSKPASEAPNPAKDVPDVADTGLADVGLPSPASQLTSVPMGRPQLARNQPQPPPPHQPPPPPAPLGNPNDSLSLMQLRRIITEFPRIDPISYTFQYTDTAPFEEEVDEWFSYNQAEFRRLLRARDTFERRWRKFAGKTWLEVDLEERERFIRKEIHGLHATDLRRRCKSLQTVLHIILGVWDETAGKVDKELEPKGKTRATDGQLEHMKFGLLLVARCGGISVIYEIVQNALKHLW